MSSTQQEDKFTVRSAIRQGMSWADHEDSPGWTARTPPKFSEEMPEITLDEQEYDRSAVPKRTSSTATSGASSSSIPIFVNGLDYALTSSDLEAFFNSNGVKVSRVRVQKGPTGKSNGKAFLNVSDKAALEAILKLDNTQLSGRALMIKEDAGPPAKTAKPTTSKFGGKWRQEETKPASGWQAVAKGGKIVEAPRVAHKKVVKAAEESAPVEESSAPAVERKPLVLKPRTKPLEEPEVQRSAIFGAAKPRDEKKFEKPVVEEEPVVVETPKPVVKKVEPVAAPTVVVVEPVVVPKKAKKNRFAVFSSDEE